MPCRLSEPHRRCRKQRSPEPDAGQVTVVIEIWKVSILRSPYPSKRHFGNFVNQFRHFGTRPAFDTSNAGLRSFGPLLSILRTPRESNSSIASVGWGGNGQAKHPSYTDKTHLAHIVGVDSLWITLDSTVGKRKGSIFPTRLRRICRRAYRRNASTCVTADL